NPDEGPEAPTPLAPGDPRPIFRLRRGHPGLGLFAGSLAGGVAAIALSPGLPVFLAGSTLGWLIGRFIRVDVCSDPRCREALPSEAEECPRCKGTVAGTIRYASEHYSASADVRRELAALRAKEKGKSDAPKPAPKRSRRRARAEAQAGQRSA